MDRDYLDRDDVLAYFAPEPRQVVERVLEVIGSAAGRAFRTDSYFGIEHAGGGRRVVLFLHLAGRDISVPSAFTLPPDLYSMSEAQGKNRLIRFSEPSGSNTKGPSPSRFDWPAIEWLRNPVNLATGDSQGAPRMRHFAHCDHFYRVSDTGADLNQPAYRATDEEMNNLPPCKDCVRRASAAGLPSVGEREPPTAEPDLVTVDAEASAPTDYSTIVRSRAEQSSLRRALVGSGAVGRCDLCARELPTELLIAAHIVPRARLSDAERRDFRRAAMLACSLGCDAMFELGLVVVDAEGVIRQGRPTEVVALREVVASIAARTCTAHDEYRSARFAEHLQLHLGTTPATSP